MQGLHRYISCGGSKALSRTTRGVMPVMSVTRLRLGMFFSRNVVADFKLLNILSLEY